MDFEVSDSLAAYRTAAQDWIRQYVDPSWAKKQKETGINHTPALHKLLAEQGWYAAGWPAEYGGSDKDVDAARTLLQEIAKLGIKHDGWSTTSLVLNILLQVGTEDQKRAYIPAGLAGDVRISLGYTEPGSGSDMAAARSRAVRQDDSWVINGQKMFTSTADQATHIFMLTRTDPDAAKHAGLTLFLVPTAAEGFEWHPVETLGGQRTTATFYTDVVVPDEARVGEVNGGWNVMGVALVFERGAGIGPRPPSGTSGNIGTQKEHLIERVVRWTQERPDPDGSLRWTDDTVRERIGRMAVESEVAKLLWLRSTWIADTGGMPGTEGSAAKLYMTETDQRHHQDMLDIMAPHGLLDAGSDAAPLDAAVEQAFRYGVVGTVYGGSSEIMREIVAERQLGLPRVRKGIPQKARW